MNHLKKAVAGLANTLGYTVIPNWMVEKYSQSKFIGELFALLKIDCVFDVGANTGQFGSFLRNEVGYKGLIVSFEPIPACLSKLNALAKADGNWLVEPYALGRRSGKKKFRLMADSQFSSFLEPDHSHVGMFLDMNKVVEEIDVEIRTLEDVFDRIKSSGNAESFYLKLDTQGYDLDVAAGASTLICEFRALQTEASVVPIYNGAPNYADAITFFQNLGFELSGIFPNNQGHFPRMIEFDCHMINKNYLS